MRLKILNSNSDGNCIILQSAEEQLMLDCGVDYKSTMVGLDFNISNLSGILATHHHIDHIRSIDKFADKGIPTIMPFNDDCKHYSLKKGSRFRAKAFAIKNTRDEWCHSNGDGSPCPVYGFIVEHEEMGKLLYATDFNVMKYKFIGLNHIIMECNYDMDLLDDTGEAKENHVFSGHSSLQQVCRFLERNDNSQLKTVVLSHISQSNGDPKHFIEEVSKIVSCPVYIAKKGLNINL